MVKKDRERVVIPDETHEGSADFHAAGRHSHITGLLTNGATLVGARELARHADVRMTINSTPIGLQDQADALAELPNPNEFRVVGGLDIGWASGGAWGQGGAPAVSEGDRNAGLRNEQTPDCSGVVSTSDASCHQVAACSEVEAAGLRFAKCQSQPKCPKQSDLPRMFRQLVMRFFSQTRQNRLSN